MFLLFALIAIGLIIWLANSGKRTADRPSGLSSQLAERNQQWVNFIAGYVPFAKTKSEKALLQRMLADIAAQELGTPSIPIEALPTTTTAAPAAAGMASAAAADAATIQLKKPSQPIDNTSLLLYFGAFLFVASVGLFIAFGGASGTLRTFAVLLVAFVMYSGGIWLFKNRPRLEQAALTFAGIGIVIAPLVGAAAYSYLFNKHHGAAVWLVTSLLSMALYVHALVTLRKPLISYLLIFSFLSLFESGISVASAPVYYFGWGLAFVGIILQLVSRLKGYWPELQESSRQSAQILLPVSLLTAFALTPEQGAVQLGISLLLAAAFYGLEVFNSSEAEQEANAIVAQVTAVAGVGSIAYGASHSWLTTAIVLLVLNAVQLLAVVAAKPHKLWHNYGSVLMASGIATMLMVVNHPAALIAATGLEVVTSATLWWRQRRPDAFGLAMLAWMALPYLAGQLLLDPRLTANAQAWLALSVLVTLMLAILWQQGKGALVVGWHESAQASYLIAAISVAVASIFASPLISLGVAAGIALTMIVLAEAGHNTDWAEAAALFLFVPMARSWDDKTVFLLATCTSLVAFIALSLRYRRELLRWGSALVWLLLPFALGRGSISSVWTPAEYAWAYVLAMGGLIVSRAIARGVLFVSGKIPLTSYARSASLSYVVGYYVAALVALLSSLFAADSRLHTSLILAIYMVVVWGLSTFVEKRTDILTLLPLLAQGLLLSVVRPAGEGGLLSAYLVISTVLAALSYWLAALIAGENPAHKELTYSVKMSLLTAFITPLSVIFVDHATWPMPLGLLAAGALLSYHVRTREQSVREWSGAVISLSLMWFLGVWEVHAFQAYVHIVIATLGFYAYWRAARGEHKQSDNYLWWMLATATIPLGLQALGGESGGLYGWWLLLEQVVIMLLGMAIRKRFVTLWGLYVAIGAVLYQLRNLGYAALAVLAIFLIGLAVYRLQKRTDLKP